MLHDKLIDLDDLSVLTESVIIGKEIILLNNEEITEYISSLITNIYYENTFYSFIENCIDLLKIINNNYGIIMWKCIEYSLQLSELLKVSLTIPNE